jgi:phage terminase small subunit
MGSSTQQSEQRRLRVVAFVDGRLRGLSNKDAAIAAGFNEKTAAAAGSRMAKSNDVLSEIRQRGVSLAAASHSVDPVADSPSADAPDQAAGLDDAMLVSAAVKWVDGASFLLAVVNAPRADMKIRVDAAFKYERIKAGFGASKEKAPSLFDMVPASADAWASQGGSRAH